MIRCYSYCKKSQKLGAHFNMPAFYIDVAWLAFAMIQASKLDGLPKSVQTHFKLTGLHSPTTNVEATPVFSTPISGLYYVPWTIPKKALFFNHVNVDYITQGTPDKLGTWVEPNVS